MKKYKLAFASEKPINFAFGEANYLVGLKPGPLPAKIAKAIMEQYPGWIEQAPAPAKAPTEKPHDA
jgi:hypothetical protein